MSDRSHEQLEAERDFPLKSLDDLEAERAAGGIDDDSYRALHDDYTARAAATIRALRDGVDARPTASATSWQRRTLVIGANGPRAARRRIGHGETLAVGTAELGCQVARSLSWSRAAAVGPRGPDEHDEHNHTQCRPREDAPDHQPA